MSVDTREVPYEVAPEGGFPTPEEFEGVWSALADAAEFGLDPLLRRLVEPLVDAYEAENEARVDWSYENLGVLVAKAHHLEVICSDLVDKVESLWALVRDLGDVIDSGGRVEISPRFNKYGSGEYVPSNEALERWGLADAR